MNRHEHKDLIEAMMCPECKDFDEEQVPGMGQKPNLGHSGGEPFNSGQNAGAVLPFKTKAEM